MDAEIQQLNESERKISIELPQDETQRYFEEILKKEAKKITVPGFRKGKAPLSLVKKMYGDAIFYDNLDKIAQNKFWDEIDTKGIEVLGIPKLTELDLTEDGGLKFEIQFEVLPQIEIENFNDIEVEKEEFEISEKFIEDYIEYIRFQLRTEEPAEEVSSMEFIVVLENLTTSEATTNKDESKIPIYLKNQELNQEFVNLLIGKKLNEEFETSIPLTTKEKETEKADAENQNYRYKILEINKVNLPEVNDELAKKYTDGKIETLEELKKTIVKEELAYLNQEAQLKFEKAVRDKFLEKYKFTPPPSLVEKQMKFIEDELRKKHKNFKMFDEIKNLIKDTAEKDVRWFLITKAIKEKYNLFLTNEEIDAYAQELAEKHNQDKNSILAYLYSNKSNLLSIKETDKYFNFLLSQIQIKTKKVII